MHFWKEQYAYDNRNKSDIQLKCLVDLYQKNTHIKANLCQSQAEPEVATSVFLIKLQLKASPESQYPHLDYLWSIGQHSQVLKDKGPGLQQLLKAEDNQ